MINWLVLLISTAVFLLGAEVILRIAGYRPWQPKVYADRPSIHMADPLLGWTLKPGEFLLPPYAPSGSEIHYTFLGNGLRKSHPGQTAVGDGRRVLLFVGGSYTQGWAISDRETFPWKLQEKRPDVEVLNYAVGGYGTYQALLKLESVLPELKRPGMVIYGFIEHHESRNVASALWLETLSRFSRKEIDLPFVTRDGGGRLVRHPPEHYPVWPLREHSALVALLQKSVVRGEAARREQMKRDVTERLLQEMDALSRRYGNDFMVVILEATDAVRRHYLRFLRRNHIRVADCAFPLTRKTRVPGEGHPNAIQNSKWADCIDEALNKIQVQRAREQSPSGPGEASQRPRPAG
ncbi:MAG TPA: SGNH/GDSL hydrolase family protein [Sedimenticola sp.]|nr:SGNH/GDSL hydrolase family protein [Sedimenticola sp.]